MNKLNTYLKTSFGIIMLLLVYVLSIQLETEDPILKQDTSITHISAKKNPSLLAKAHHPPKQDTRHKNPRKMHVAKHISLKLTIPNTAYNYHIGLLEPVISYSTIQEKYKYLYFREINPPPPKGC